MARYECAHANIQSYGKESNCIQQKSKSGQEDGF